MFPIFTSTMDKNHMTERILNLTLEILYLLTGEDYSVVTKGGTHVETIRGIPCQPGGLCKMVSPIPEVPEKNKNQKILDLTNRIIHLLTGEVPVRHEDIIVCFSMEEWEYVEGHKDLYKDLMMDSGPFLGSTDLPTSEKSSMKLKFHMPSPEDHSLCRPKAKSHVLEDVQEVTLPVEHDRPTDPSTSTKYIQTEPADPGEGVMCEDEEDEVIFVPTENTPMRSSSDASRSYSEETPKDSDFCLLTEQIQNTTDHIGNEVESGLPADNIYTPACLKSDGSGPTEWVTNVNFVACPTTPHPINTQYTSRCIIEVSSVCEEGNVTSSEVYAPPDHKTSLYPSDEMSWRKDVLYTNVYTPAELTQEDLTSIKRELVSWEDGSLELPSIYIPQKALEEKVVSTGGGGGQWNGGPSLENLSPHMKMEYEPGDFVDHYATPGQTQLTYVPVNPEDKEAEKKMLMISYTTDEGNGGPPYDASQMYSCSDCKKCFSSVPNLAKHRMLCKGRKSHVCSRCGKCFASASYLVIHERIHTGEKPYSCSHCGKSFTRKPDLIRHERIHTGEKPFACPECGKCFTSVSNIFMHRRIHTGEKPFPCAECGKRFIKKSDLVRHEKIHVPQKPVPCPQCGKIFASKTILSKHMAAHAGEKSQTPPGGS